MSGHISPKSTYYAVFAALMLGTALTVAAAFVDFPAQMNFPVALAIAMVKGSLVALFFMHLRDERRLIYSVLALTALFFLCLMFIPLFTNLDKIAMASR